MVVSTSPNSGMLATRPIWLPFTALLADDLMASPMAKLGGTVGQATGSQPAMSSVGRDPAFLTGSFHEPQRPRHGRGKQSTEAGGQAVPSTWLSSQPPRIFPHFLLLAVGTLIRHTRHTRNNPNPVVGFSLCEANTVMTRDPEEVKKQVIKKSLEFNGQGELLSCSCERPSRPTCCLCHRWGSTGSLGSNHGLVLEMPSRFGKHY